MRRIASSCLSAHPSVCPPARLANHGPHWTDLHEIWYLRIFGKYVKIILNFIKIWQECRVLYTKTSMHFLSYLAQFFLESKMFRTKFVDKIKRHFWLVNPPQKIMAVYGMMWKNIVEPGRPQMTIWRIPIPCWIPKATDAHLEYVILIAFLLRKWLHPRASAWR